MHEGPIAGLAGAGDCDIPAKTHAHQSDGPVPRAVREANFWSLTIYDTYDRVQIDTPSQVADISSRKEGLKTNADGSVDLYVGPEQPSGWEQNWIDTVPGKAWFAYFRFYGPTEGYFERTYALPDFEEVAK